MRISIIDQFVTNAGQIERPIVGEGWIRPSAVDLNSARELLYVFEPPYKRVHPRPGMLRDFLRLADAPDEKILRYARRWGALTETALDVFTQRTPSENPIARGIRRAMHWPETTDHWRSECRAINKVLELAAKVETARGRIGTKDLSGRERKEVGAWEEEIATAINRGLLASVSPQLVWSEGVPQIWMHVNRLSGALAAELMLMVARKDGLALCGSCGSPFETDGKRTVYCIRCGKQAAWRAASRKLYKAKQQAYELFCREVPLNDIADKVGKPITVIRRWRKKWMTEGRKGVGG